MLYEVITDWSPAPGWKLYGQYALDQGRAPNESSAQANAMAYLGGVERGVAARNNFV